MSLRPIDVRVTKKVGVGKRVPSGTVARSDIYRVLHELRARTVLRDEDDPLHDTDWWSVVEDDAAEGIYRRIWRIKQQHVLPEGLWNIRTHRQRDHHPLIVARFEGYEPWWLHASKRAWHESYLKVVRAPREPGVPAPPIAELEYEDVSEPTHIKDQRDRGWA